MKDISRRDGTLYIEQVKLSEVALAYGTPVFVYSRNAIEQAWHRVTAALAHRAHLICYAVKANSSLAVLDVLARLGSGFDIVSGGELNRVLAAGGDPQRVVFSGVGKRADEMEQGLSAGIRCFNVESVSELKRLSQVAQAHSAVAPVSLRINPDVDARTHRYISTGLRENKFGIGIDVALQVYRQAATLPGIDIRGIDCHIGSQLTEIEPFCQAFDHLVHLVDALVAEGVAIQHIDVGGGQGIRYRDEAAFDIDAWAGGIDRAIGDRDLEVIVEPGRYIVGEAGVLLSRIEYLKNNGDRRFAVVDAAMNDLIRPALYDAWQAIEATETRDCEAAVYDVVGPVCESADFLGKQRRLSVAEGDLLAVMSAGAYGAVMSSNYNTRPRAAEVMVDGDCMHLIRAREPIEALYADEYVLP